MKKLAFSLMLLARLMLGQQPAGAGGVCGDAGFLFRVYFNLMEIGSITGVSYEDGRYLLYATKPVPGHKPVILYRDTVVQLARLLMVAGDDEGMGFSLDFLPSGRNKFGADDVLDAQKFGELLASDRKFAVALRASTGAAEIVKQCEDLKKDEKPSKALRKRIADLLNQARARPDIESHIAPEELRAETRVFLKTIHDPQRRNRIEIEDFFLPSINEDVEDKYQVTFKASTSEAQEKMRPLLIDTRAAAIWLAADTRLKMMVAGKEEIAKSYQIGPSQQMLCGEEAQRQLARGVDLDAGQYLDYFRLHIDYEDMGGVGEWFKNPRLEARAGVVAGKGTPSCALEFSARLTKRLPWILEQNDPVADDLRALREILLLHRAICYLFETAPMSLSRLDLLQRDSGPLPTTPPTVLKSEILIGAHGEAHLFKIAGGIDWGGANPAPHPPKSDAPPRVAEGPLRDNGAFLVTDLPDGEMRIDITLILAP